MSNESENRDVWAAVRMDDRCMWRLRGRTWDEEPSLEEIQESVGGGYELMPQIYLMDDIQRMYINDEGRLHRLELNEMATKQTNMLCPHPVVGNVIIQVDEKVLTAEYWLGDE